MGCVYLATNTLNNKCYVGITAKELLTRVEAHCKRASLRSDTALHRAIRKHGIEAFEWKELVFSEDLSVLKNLEKVLIRELGTRSPDGYNLTDGGDGLLNPTDETRSKIGAAQRGRKRPARTDEYRQKLRQARQSLMSSSKAPAFRKKLSDAKKKSFSGTAGDEIKRKIGSGNRGKKLSEEWKEKLRESRRRFLNSEAGKALIKRLSESYKGRKLSAETRRKMGLSRLGNLNAIGGNKARS